MIREFFNSLLVLFVLFVVSILACRANAAPPPTLQPYPLVRMLQKPPQQGQLTRNFLRRVNAARPGIVVPKLPH